MGGIITQMFCSLSMHGEKLSLERALNHQALGIAPILMMHCVSPLVYLTSLSKRNQIKERTSDQCSF